MKVFKCEKCGKMLMTMADSGCIPHCCGEEMTLLKANTTDGALEKHVPAVVDFDFEGLHLEVFLRVGKIDGDGVEEDGGFRLVGGIRLPEPVPVVL